MLDPLILLLLVGVGAAAGFVDAVAGGGGMITVPVLLSLGFSPVAALATNKMASVTGTLIAATTYWRKGFVSLKRLLPAIAATFVGSALGAVVVQNISTDALQVAVPVALIAIALYFSFAPKLDDTNRAERLRFALFLPLFGFGIGFYDGIFGPGAGSFFTVAFVTLFGLGLTRASAHTKVLNAVSNLAALMMFIVAGEVIWVAALAMMVGQVAGGYLGALTGIRFGAKVIRPLVVVVSVVMALRLLFAG